VLERNLSATKKGGVLSVSGVRVETTCTAGQATVRLVRDGGRAVADEDRLVVVATDFVALGGDGGLGVAEERIVLDEGEPVREHLARVLSARGGHLDSTSYFTPDTARMTTSTQQAGVPAARCGP
jgi:hypothetical protein